MAWAMEGTQNLQKSAKSRHTFSTLTRYSPLQLQLLEVEVLESSELLEDLAIKRLTFFVGLNWQEMFFGGKK